VHDFFKSSSGIRASAPPFFNAGDNYTDDLPAVQEEMPFPQIVIRSSDFVICKFFVSANVSFLLGKRQYLEHSPYFHTAFMGRALD
jgi:hypothetical protein